MNKEITETIRYYRDKGLRHLSKEELLALMYNLEDHFLCILADTWEPLHVPVLKPPPLKKVDKRKPWRIYNKHVRMLSKTVDMSTDANYSKPRVLNRTHFQSNNHYVVDHKISVTYGYKNGIPAEHIADRSNLRYITGRENALKSFHNHVDHLNFWILPMSIRDIGKDAK